MNKTSLNLNMKYNLKILKIASKFIIIIMIMIIHTHNKLNLVKDLLE